MFIAGAAARIGLAREQEGFEAFGTAKRIRFFEYLDDGFGPQFERPMAMRMVLGHQQAEVATGARHRQPVRQFANQPAAALLMPGM